VTAIITCRSIAFALLLLAYPLSYMLADWWSWENGPIELLDNAVLFAGAVQAIWLAFRDPSPRRWLWVAVLPIWVVCLARELAFGAVFFPPIGMDDDGPVFSSKVLACHGLIAPAVALLALVSLVTLVRFKLWRLVPVIIRARQLPTLEFVMTAISFLAMTAAERHMHMSLDPYVGIAQVVEETVELAGYMFLLTAQQRVRKALMADRAH